MKSLSANAVGRLRFRIKGYKMPVRDRDLPTYGELVDAGILEPDGKGDFRFTEWGMAHREEILEREAERIERERYEPPDTSRLSAAAWALLRRSASGEDVAVTEANKPVYRELAAARIMSTGHSFVGGREAEFRFTYWGREMRDQWLARETA